MTIPSPTLFSHVESHVTWVEARDRNGIIFGSDEIHCAKSYEQKR